jgi:hypothetical protein
MESSIQGAKMKRSVLIGGAFMLLAIGVAFGVEDGMLAGRPFIANALVLLVMSFATTRQVE